MQFKPEFVVSVTKFALDLVDSISDLFDLNEMFNDGVATEMRYQACPVFQRTVLDGLTREFREGKKLNAFEIIE